MAGGYTCNDEYGTGHDDLADDCSQCSSTEVISDEELESWEMENCGAGLVPVKSSETGVAGERLKRTTSFEENDFRDYLARLYGR